MTLFLDGGVLETPVLDSVPSEAVELFGVTLVGVSATTGVKLLFTAVLVLAVLGLRGAARAVVRRALGGRVADPRRFWARQGLQVLSAVVLVLGVFSIWVTPETDLTTGVGLLSAGLAFALQQVLLSLAAYFVILRGNTFGVGDRVSLGGVRGDVVRLGFLKTTVMEMGQPPSAGSGGADPAGWVHSRQYTGRLVTVTNGVIFDEPVYNYTRDFPYLWEEIALPVPYGADRARAEAVLLAAARDHAVVDDPAAEAALARMRTRYAISDASLEPAVYWRLTDNWLEMSLRFLVPHRGVRAVKDAVTRQVLAGLDEAGIGIASATHDIVGLPPLRIEEPPARRERS
ncbi:mechanosensitive ion channel family protein [Paenibacillus sp. TRM 82003]|uniref:mechanosensitive ion channel family protein n=1 Tax=Kineococcus sp. TRM81007 TaxID=2925831 RepID=UPI001F596DB8|nr:mechanosensitive ion channel domain-containing protein [Kineococcus sp. TRM81007]MCI2240469.1 mechanosensitive ion channel family protein [Kineococcus sp. TRM81007]MCI3925202.1 mechanosensitive ion channel family protein [Paenibacillus sp. TRM 82003]